MSHFANELEAAIKEKSINAAELSRISGVDQATISRVRSGEQKISHDDLDKIAVALDRRAPLHARLLSARLREDLRPPGGHLITIDVLGAEPALKDQPKDYGAPLPPKIQRAMNVIAANVVGEDSADLRSIVISIANLYEKGSLS